MQNPKVYIVILNYLQWEDTRDCLESVLSSTYNNYTVLIIDNNSPNDSWVQLIDWACQKQIKCSVFTRELFDHSVDLLALPLLNFIRNDKNSGFAAGNNLALDLLTGQDAYVWLLNPDMILREETLTEFMNFIPGQPAGAIAGAELRSYHDKQEILFYGGGRVRFFSATIRKARKPEDIAGLDYISGACLFTHTSSFKKNGLLPEEYFLYWEETDWCFRAKNNGMPLLVCPTAVCYDKISTVIGKGFLSDYYYCRNGLLFISKFRKGNVAPALASAAIRWFKRIFTGQWSRARGIYKGTIDFLKKKFNAAQ